MTVAGMAGQTNSGFLLGGNRFIAKTKNSGNAFAAARFCVLKRIGMTGLTIRPFLIALLAMFRG